jgi:hypothetical protein
MAALARLSGEEAAMARRIVRHCTALSCLVLMLAALPAAAMEDRRHWDWGQHHTSLTGPPPRPVPAPSSPWQYWDENGPVRIVVPAPP